MTLVDLGIVLFTLSLAAVGWQRGLVASALPLAGFIGGAALGARVGPELLPDGAESSYAPLVSVLTGVLLGSFLAVAVDGMSRRLRSRLLGSSIGVLDGLGGAILLGALALLLVWGFGAVALHANGNGARDLRRAVQESSILGVLNDALPPSGPLLHVLRRVDPTPTVHGPDANVPAPDQGSADDPEVRRAGDSTVKVLGSACGLGVEGSGWVAGPGLVVTNAHVVAGEDDTTVNFDDGTQLDATVVHYDSRNDLAVLAVDGMDAPALALAAHPRKGTDAAVIGYPENGSLSFESARLGRTGTVTSQDSYGRGPVQRKMTPFRADVRSGNSGGPVVDLDGRVLTTVFAASTGPGDANGLGVPNAIVSRALDGKLEPVDPGPCAA